MAYTEAQKEASRRYYYRNRERLLEEKKKYYRENVEEFKIRNKNNKKRNHDPLRIIVSAHFDPATVKIIDENAKELGLTRSSYIRKIVFKALNEK